ncbi:hypothetical protein JCM8547_007982 [Rhodosporidiobolus lusitaniae]
MSPVALADLNTSSSASPVADGLAPEAQRKSSYLIASIPGDGIGLEVISAGQEVLKAVAKKNGFSFEFTHFDWSSAKYLAEGSYLPKNYLELLKPHDAIYFGAVGSPKVPDHISLWGLRLAICQPLQMYNNVRPTRVLKGTTSPLRDLKPGQLDWVIVRENSEGEYAGHGGRSHVGYEHEVGTEVSIFTRTGIRRIARSAFQIAQSRPRKQLCYVTKSNAQRNGLVLWDEVILEVAKEFPDVKVDKMLVDAMTVRMVMKPESLDTIVATNLHADILSDLAAALAGSIGIAPTANLDPSRKHPSMFEPISGSADDIAGLGIANPLGSFWSAAMMLEWLGEFEGSKQLLDAMERVCEKGIKTRDLGGSANTKEVTEAVIAEILSGGK